MNERSSYQSFKCQRFTSSHCKDILGFEHICLFKESILYQKKLTSFDKVYIYSVYSPPPPCIIKLLANLLKNYAPILYKYCKYWLCTPI